MGREISWGTPSRSGRYLPLRKKSDLLLLALLAGVIVAGVLLAAQVTGARTAISPGAISSGHAPLAENCDACHARFGLASARCTRCHDPEASEHLGHAAHVARAAASGEAKKAVAEVACDRCHGEHRGRDMSPRSVPSAECAQCHFRSFAVHPQFAVIRERREEQPGLRFDHSAHIALLVETKGGGGSAICTRCHEPSRARSDYAPLSFERHCASCHEGVKHRDPELLRRWYALWRRLDETGFAAELEALRARETKLKDRLARIGRPLDGGDPPPPVLTLEARKELEHAIEEIAVRRELISPQEPEAPLPLEASAAARAELEKVSEPCRGCHVTTPEGGFVPVQAARSVLRGANFRHAPHLLFSDCARCHASVAQSKRAEELHLEGVDTCRGCHGAKGVRDDCQTCHRYHPEANW